MVIEYFNIDETPCKSYLPDSNVVEIAVLAVHGFAGDKESSAIAALAERLYANNAAVYCFDFPAHGAHPSDELTIDACKSSLIKVACYLRSQHPLTRYAVFATSFGGYMALQCLDDLTEVLGAFSLVLRAPAVKMPMTFESRILGADGLKQLETAGSIECGFERKIAIGEEFLDDLRSYDACRPFARPMLIIHGDKDDIVTTADILDFMRQNPQAQLAQVAGADHRFKGDGQIESVVEAAQAYIDQPM